MSTWSWRLPALTPASLQTSCIPHGARTVVQHPRTWGRGFIGVPDPSMPYSVQIEYTTVRAEPPLPWGPAQAVDRGANLRLAVAQPPPDP
jgi:hypothetical protein